MGIGDDLEDPDRYACLSEDVLHPILATTNWEVWNGNQLHEDPNVILEKVTEEQAPDVIQLKGREGYNSKIDGTYFISRDEKCYERIYYKKKDESCFIYWYPESNRWQIEDVRGEQE